MRRVSSNSSLGKSSSTSMRKSISGSALSDLVQPEIIAHVPVTNYIKCEYLNGGDTEKKFPEEVLVKDKAICLATPEEVQSNDVKKEQLMINENDRFDRWIQVVRRKRRQNKNQNQ